MYFLQHPARVNTPDIDEGVVFDHVQMVVQVHGRVAMRGRELDVSPDGRCALAGFENEAAVLVAIELVARPGKGLTVQFGSGPSVAKDLKPALSVTCPGTLVLMMLARNVRETPYGQGLPSNNSTSLYSTSMKI